MTSKEHPKTGSQRTGSQGTGSQGTGSQGTGSQDKAATGERKRILLAKPGLDGHDRGVKVVALALREAGFQVTYTGLRQSVKDIMSLAEKEAVDCIGLSILSGSHIPLCQEMKPLFETSRFKGCLWIVGGNIPAQDRPALEALGVHKVFPTGSPLGDIVGYLKEALI